MIVPDVGDTLDFSREVNGEVVTEKFIVEGATPQEEYGHVTLDLKLLEG